MKTIIAGSRTITDPAALDRALEHAQAAGLVITEVVSGTARGVDQLGEAWARRNLIPVRRFPADWDKLGKSAGFRRNRDMVQYSQALVVLYDGVSKGTAHTLDLAQRGGLLVYQYDSEGRP